MNRAQIFPTIIIVLSVGAAIFYGLDGDTRRVIYWLAGATITASVTF